MWFLSGLGWIILGFILVELSGWLERRRAIPKEDRKNIRQAIRSVLPQEKAEYLPPMTEEEYEAHMDAESEHGELVKGVLSKLPWNSKPPNSPSSDS